MTFSNNLIIYVNYENNNIDSESSLPYHATLTFAGKQYKCSVGRNGINHKGQEGDGVTPIGEFTLRMGFFRSDRVDSSILSKVKGIPLIELHENYGWCDDMFDPVHYNRLIQLPVLEGLSSEKLWRQDNLYPLGLPLIFFSLETVLKSRKIFDHFDQQVNGFFTSQPITEIV